MAPVESGNVTVDVRQLKRLAQLFLDWSQDVDLLVPGVKDKKITPGWVANGTDLKTRFDLRVTTGYVGLLDNLHKSLFEIGQELVKAADDYVDAEGENTDDLGRLDELIASVKRVYTAQESPSAP